MSVACVEWFRSFSLFGLLGVRSADGHSVFPGEGVQDRVQTAAAQM